MIWDSWGHDHITSFDSNDFAAFSSPKVGEATPEDNVVVGDRYPKEGDHKVIFLPATLLLAC